MSVDIIFPELFSGKADSHRYFEKFRYILSLLRYSRVKPIFNSIPKNYPYNMFFIVYVCV